MKTLLPLLGAIALAASLFVAFNDRAFAQSSSAPSPPPRMADIAEVRFLEPIALPGDPPTTKRWGIEADSEGTIRLRESEFILSTKAHGNLRIPMSSVAYFKIVGDN